jgi:hypothetical protein
MYLQISVIKSIEKKVMIAVAANGKSADKKGDETMMPI